MFILSCNDSNTARNLGFSMDMRAAAETAFMDDGLSPDRSLEYSLHKKRFSFKRKEASNALFKKPQVQPSEFTCAIMQK